MSQPEQTMSGGSMAAAKTSNINASYDNKKTSTKIIYNTGNTKFEGCIDTLKTLCMTLLEFASQNCM